jgi:ribosome-associated protein
VADGASSAIVLALPATWRCDIATASTSNAAAPADAKERLEQARQFAIDVARLAADTKSHNVAVLDVSGISPVTDFMVLATGTSARQMRTVINDIEEMALPRDWKPYTRSGLEGESWMVLDFIDVVLHVFNPESRQFYDLESLWGDAPKVSWHR